VIRITEQNGSQGLSRKARQKALHPEKRDDEVLLKEMQDMALRLRQTSFLTNLDWSVQTAFLLLGKLNAQHW